MPYDDPSPDDPQMLVGVLPPGSAESMRTMAEVFAEEFARLGYTARHILGLFQDPHFSGAHAALRALGEPAVRELVDAACRACPVVRIIDAGTGGERGPGPRES